MVALAFERSGDGPAGPPVLLLPAFPLDRAVWRHVAALLDGLLPTVLVDLPGQGDSPLPGDGPPSLDAGADAVAALAARLGYRRVIVAGVSMGGYVAMSLARRHPDLLAGVALVDTRHEADTPEARANRERIAGAVLGEAGLRALAPMVGTLLGESTRRLRPETVAWLQGRLQSARPAGVAWSQRAMAARPDSGETLARLEVPAAVVVGEEDVLTPPGAARAMAALIPDAVLTVLPRSGHLSPIEAPAGVANALIGLQLRVSARRAP